MTRAPYRAQRGRAKRIKKLEASLERLNNMNFPFGQRYLSLNIPAAFAEAVENDAVVRVIG